MMIDACLPFIGPMNQYPYASDLVWTPSPTLTISYLGIGNARILVRPSTRSELVEILG